MRTHSPRTLLGVATVCLFTVALPTVSAGASPAEPASVADSTVSIRSDTAAPVNPGPDLSINALPSGYEFTTLQLNLCNSGHADCYRDGLAVPEAYGIIGETEPDLITLNEVCEDDVRDELWPLIREIWGNDWTFWAFQPAGDRRTGGAYTCTDGQRFGNGMLGRMFATGSNPKFGLHGQLYTEDLQDHSSPEQRSWLCVNSANNYWGCTTHTFNGGNNITLRQCEHLMKAVIPWIWAADIRLPSVVGGDFNLRYGGSPDMQTCVPSGWYRKGDGAVQHIMATNNLTFDDSLAIPMLYTDHPAWLVSVRTP
jgi:hypothetical protein